jgi:hypothetical protein
MQTLLFSRVVELRPQISFPCTVNGKDLTATLTHTEYTGLQMLYRVQFSDGHSHAYSPGDEEVREGFGRTRTLDSYEEAVFEDLRVVHHLENGNWYINVRVCEEGGEGFNVWIKEKNGHYSVYYKGQYQFTLRKRVGWEWGTMREKGYVVNGRLAKLLADYLDEQHLKETRQLKRA